jgi:hypothetical protein
MVLIPVFWTKYTATMRGRVLKVVPCENCSTEYVYLMEREGSGVGTSMYMLNDQGAEGHSKAAATDTLRSVLENDFDPVPCPVCGHYQRYMFPKLLETKGLWRLALKVAGIMIGCIAALSALQGTIGYLQSPNDHSIKTLLAAWSVLLLLGVIGLGLWLVNKFKVRHFDPNVGDPAGRIALGRSRAVTRAEFAQGEQEQR